MERDKVCYKKQVQHDGFECTERLLAMARSVKAWLGTRTGFTFAEVNDMGHLATIQNDQR